MPPSLLDYLCTSLQSHLAGTHPNLVLSVLRSDPQRSHALFPHATNAKTTKVYHEDIFVVLSQPVSTSAGSKEGEHEQQQPERVVVPVVGIEAALYTIPATGTALVYISKVDTTGLSSPSSPSSAPSPTRPLVSAFLSYFLQHPPHSTTRVRIHIFARAQSQYLFPGSVDNKAKKILDDKALIRWWKRTIERAVETQPPTTTKLFYLIPGLAYLESLPYVPASAPSSPSWIYSHPYSSLSSPLHPSSDPPSSHPLVDHIPAFPDDPKSRFLHSLTSSSVSPSGTEGDYDDVYLSLASNSFTTGSTPAQKVHELERAIERERKRLTEGVPGGVDEWWERMAFRQECCAGQLVGFFVVAAGEPSLPIPSSSTTTADAPTPTSSSHAPKRHPLSLRPPTYTKLWSQLHNYDYALPALVKLGEAVAKWEEGLEQALKAEEDLDGDKEGQGAKGEEASTESREGEGKTEANEAEAEAEAEAQKLEAREREWRKRYEKFVRREISITNPHLLPPLTSSSTTSNSHGNGDGNGIKRPAQQQQGGAEEAPKVNVLAPRKKKKVV
ncbi:hypothetical protein JCM10908_006766 [Rhodotorula pacifica]|uniref:H3 histone acetyltransferase RTT109 n=1 Tax=Rhodotorula pacifica TaxID=1495444 RepID=UPI00317FBD8F